MSIETAGLGEHGTPRSARRVYTIEEVGRLLGLSRNAAYVAARNDRLPCPVIKIGRRMMVSKAAFDAAVPVA